MHVVSGRASAARRVSYRLAPVLAVCVALAAGGCADSRDKYAEAAQVRAMSPQVAQAEVETEADGLPAQLPPLRRAKPEMDDPSEPFSPNYGNPGAAKRADVSFVRPR